MNEPIAFNTKDVMEKIIKVRGMDVLLDRDVAELYGVETKRVNEALKNNPPDFVIVSPKNFHRIGMLFSDDASLALLC